MRIYLNTAGNWVTEYQGREYLVRVVDTEQEHTFRSLGLYPNIGVSITVDCNGLIENITTVNGCYVDAITIPPTHGLRACVAMVKEEHVCF